MAHAFDPGPVKEPFLTLARDYPGTDAYPADEFRTEWGPIFHRGRLDGSARVLVIGQDPAQHEAICRRILVGEAGQRAQAFLAKLGIDTSYVMINALLYSVYRDSGTERNDDPKVAGYRNRWLDALLIGTGVEAVVAFGRLARESFEIWKDTPAGQARNVAFEAVRHPTFPEGSGGGSAAMRSMLENWNEALQRLRPKIAHPDASRPFVPYDVAKRAENAAIPERDLPAGLPP